jgi:hypothetical protein
VEQQLIELYLWVCTIYDKRPDLKYQRLSNNSRPLFTDQELLTIYLFGHLQGHFSERSIYDYVRQHWFEWFPHLPSYQACDRRLNDLAETFSILLDELLGAARQQKMRGADRLLDSLPIMLASGSRAGQGKIAHQMADAGYCASKQTFYHSVKLHLLSIKRYKALPMPESLCLTEASMHDLTALRQLLPLPPNCALFADKAYADARLRATLVQHGSDLCTPDKGYRGRTELPRRLCSRLVWAIRQPLASLFHWLLQRTNLQDASQVRSTNGLLTHCYGKLTAAFCLLFLNS